MSRARGSWRLAARLARREVRRRPLRAALVVLLIVAPIFAVTVADVLVVTQQTHAPAEGFRRDYGSADVVYQLSRTVKPIFVPPLPVGSHVSTVVRAELPLTSSTGGGLRVVQVKGVDIVGDLGAAGLQLTDGRAPGRGEVMLSRNVAAWLGARLGSKISFSRPVWSARVTGFVRSMSDFTNAVLASPDFPFSTVQPGNVTTDVVVTLPPGYSVSHPHVAGTATTTLGLDRAAPPIAPDTLRTPHGRVPFPSVVSADSTIVEGFATIVPEQYGSGKSIEPLARFWSWVAVTLLLAMVGVLIAAAFATTARRQLVMLGQLSANGSDQQFLRRMLTLQGTILGVVGSGAGMGLALGALFVWRGWIESLYRHQLDYRITGDLAIIGLTAVIAATIAARFPARSTSRVPVLAALAGRRPLPPVPRLQWVKALIIFGTGVGLLALVAVNAQGGPAANVAAGVAIVGGLFVMAGVAYLTPVAVNLLAKTIGRVGAAARIGARGLVRVRGRSAAVMTAVAIAGTIATALVTAMLGLGVNRGLGLGPGPVGVLPNEVLLEDLGARYRPSSGSEPPVASAADFLAKQAEVAQVVPAIRFRTVQGFTAVLVLDHAGSVGAQNRIDELPSAVLVAIDSPTVRRVAHLTAQGRAILRRAGVVSNGLNSDIYGSGRRVRLTLAVGNGRPFVVPIAQGPQTTIDAVMTSARAYELGIATRSVLAVGSASRAITNDQRSLMLGGVADPYVGAQPASPAFGGSVQALAGYDASSYAFWRGFWTPDNLQRWFAIGAMLFVLVVVAIGLLLGASEARDENDVLEQLGVRPRTGRRMEATKAALLAFGGGVLAVPAGFIPLAVVFDAVQKPNDLLRTASGGSGRTILYPQIVFPWITAIGIVVVIPLVAALGAWVASAVAQRAHMFRRSLAFDAE